MSLLGRNSLICNEITVLEIFGSRQLGTARSHDLHRHGPAGDRILNTLSVRLPGAGPTQWRPPSFTTWRGALEPVSRWLRKMPPRKRMSAVLLRRPRELQ